MIYDYVVIGSGFGGSVAGQRLVEKEYTVLILEQGKRYNPGDFPKTNWNIPKYLWLPALRFFGFQKLSFYPTASILTGTGVGGGNLVYANTLYYPPDDFFRNSSWYRYGDWKKILEPFYDRTLFILGRKKYSKLGIEDKILKEISKQLILIEDEWKKKKSVQ
jgi:cholesterol oxidase